MCLRHSHSTPRSFLSYNSNYESWLGIECPWICCRIQGYPLFLLWIGDFDRDSWSDVDRKGLITLSVGMFFDNIYCLIICLNRLHKIAFLFPWGLCTISFVWYIQRRFYDALSNHVPAWFRFTLSLSQTHHIQLRFFILTCIELISFVSHSHQLSKSDITSSIFLFTRCVAKGHLSHIRMPQGDSMNYEYCGIKSCDFSVCAL